MKAVHTEHIAETRRSMSASYKERRYATKAMANMEEERDQALAELKPTKTNKAFEVKAVMKASWMKERHHYTGVIGGDRAKQNSLKERIDTQKQIATALVNRSVTAEHTVRSAKREANTSTHWSTELNKVYDMKSFCRQQNQGAAKYMDYSLGKNSSPCYLSDFGFLLPVQSQEMASALHRWNSMDTIESS